MKSGNYLRLAGCLVLLLLLAGCSSGGKQPDNFKRVKSERVLYAAVPEADPPYSSVNPETGGAAGREAEILNALGEQWGVMVEFLPKPREEVTAALLDGSAQVAMGRITSGALNPELAATVSYAKGSLYVVTARGDFSCTTGAFAGKTVGVEAGLSEEAMIQINGISQGTIIPYENSGQVENDIADQKISGYFCYEEQALSLMKSKRLQAQSLSGSEAEEYVIVMNGYDRNLLTVFNDGLGNLIQDGTVARIWNGRKE